MGWSVASGLPTTQELPVFALPPVSPRSATSQYRNKRKELPAVELPQRDANRCILVRGCKPEFVLLCDAEEPLHLLRSWRCGRPVRIEWPCELAEEAVEFLLAHAIANQGKGSEVFLDIKLFTFLLYACSKQAYDRNYFSRSIPRRTRNEASRVASPPASARIRVGAT